MPGRIFASYPNSEIIAMEGITNTQNKYFFTSDSDHINNMRQTYEKTHNPSGSEYLNHEGSFSTTSIFMFLKDKI